MGSDTTAISSQSLSLINLQLGWPSPRLFAASALLEGATQVLTSESETAAALIYGPHIGHPPLRKSIAEWLSSVYGTEIDHERISINNGASGNLANVLLKFTDPLYTRKIFMVEPTYFLACPIFEDNGFQGKLAGVPENDTDGLDIAFLRRELAAAEAQAIEDAQNLGRPDIPTIKVERLTQKSTNIGKTLYLQTRKDLVALARKYDALVVSDDVYDFLSWPEDLSAPDDTFGAVPPRLVDIDHDMPGYSTWGNTLSNGSFSKVIGPGVRVGWADGTPAFARELAEVGSSSSGGAPSHLTSTFVDKMLRSGSLQTHIKKTLIPTYRERYHALMASIRDILVPLGVTVEVNHPEDAAQATTGGFFAYLRLPEDLPVARIVAAIALKEKLLRFAFGHMFVVSGDKGSVHRAESKNGFSRCIRLCWAWHEIAELKEGIERLAATILDIDLGWKLARI
ncbi:aminotransferase [Colletotrichum scovillei]|uniref:aminotransferase n=1 Tax=Colletotrichum scovillei TaxID=1209932 RepID=UPI0015C3329F|nr:aminotransferase [Colletotrichum scovillei]KAF4777030.1 aminotransferase [Colletotrichum scovillei]